ncbi:MAG: ketoacyl-ACP synthase III [Gemmatimonadaceae bacterium]|nr:ketoacyl-ACP synthase III [Gemmatimonadaceae bacterium]MCC6429596.1 ketoacyl-ACP synthase III [Gemmatimonadaceae bacterium]
MKRPFAYFAGTGHAVPKQIVTNADIAAMGLETNDQWIIERTGIKQRHIAKDGESLTSLSADAARQAMARAGVQPGEIDTIVLGTASPDHLLPATAVEVQTMLGCTRAAAFDIGAACSGFLYGAIVGESLIASGSADTVLVIGAEKLSAIVDWTDRNTCILFADGAGAAVLRRTRGGQKGILSSYMRSDGALAELLWRPAGGGAEPFSAEVLDSRRQFVRMAGREVFKHAVRSMAEATDRALDAARLTAADIDLLIPHQANIRIIEATAKHAGVGMDRVFVNVDRFGNTSAASIPIALNDAIEQGRLKEGMTVLFVAFGAGFTWGSLVVRF